MTGTLPYGKQLSILADPIEVAFVEFHHAHPEVYANLVRLAREWKAAGHDRLGIKTLFEVLRWQTGLGEIRDPAGFKLNNNYTSRYARLIMANEVDLAHLFETRALSEDRKGDDS